MNATDERAALLAGVLAEPDSDEPRLVFADWLEEHGEPERAELIRCQVAVEAWERSPGEVVHYAGGTVNGAQAGAMLARSQRLLGDHAIDWLRAELGTLWHAWNGPPTWRRGFVEALSCPAAHWLEHADAIRAAAPIHAVTLWTWPEWLWIDSDLQIATLGQGFPEVFRDDMPDGCLIPQFLLEQRWPRITFTLPDD